MISVIDPASFAGLYAMSLAINRRLCLGEIDIFSAVILEEGANFNFFSLCYDPVLKYFLWGKSSPKSLLALPAIGEL